MSSAVVGKSRLLRAERSLEGCVEMKLRAHGRDKLSETVRLYISAEKLDPERKLGDEIDKLIEFSAVRDSRLVGSRGESLGLHSTLYRPTGGVEKPFIYHCGHISEPRGPDRGTTFASKFRRFYLML